MSDNRSREKVSACIRLELIMIPVIVHTDLCLHTLMWGDHFDLVQSMQHGLILLLCHDFKKHLVFHLSQPLL